MANQKLKPLFPGFKVPEIQLRNPNYPTTNSPILGSVTFTGGFMEPYGHARKPATKAIFSDKKVKNLPPSNRNLGVDYVNPDIICWYPGVVTKVGWEGGYGNRCHVTYNVKYTFNGKAYTVYGAYAHAASFSVKVNQKVTQGQRIGKQGGTGGRYPVHVDYRQWIIVNGQRIDLSPNVLEAQLHQYKPKIDDGKILIQTPKNRQPWNLGDPVQFSGKADLGIFSINFHSPFAGSDFSLGKTLVQNGSWTFYYQFMSGGERTIVADGLDAADQIISSTEVTIELVSLPNNNKGIVLITKPETNSTIELESVINLEGVAQDSRVKSIKLRSPFADKNFVLGQNIPINDGKWSYSLKFNTGGERKIVAEGFDGDGNRLDYAEIEIVLKSSKPSPAQLKDVIGIEKTTLAFRNKVVTIANEIKVDPSFLMVAMSFESAGTFSPSIQNPHSGATGLIQFMPQTAKALGTSISALIRMTAEQQLDYVKKYFMPYRGRLKSLEDVYMAILYPVAIGKGANYILFKSPSVTYVQNRGLDDEGKGYVTVGDATEKVRKRFR